MSLKLWHTIYDMEVRDRLESDHNPLCVASSWWLPEQSSCREAELHSHDVVSTNDMRRLKWSSIVENPGSLEKIAQEVDHALLTLTSVCSNGIGLEIVTQSFFTHENLFHQTSQAKESNIPEILPLV